MHLKMLSGKQRPICPEGDELKQTFQVAGCNHFYEMPSDNKHTVVHCMNFKPDKYTYSCKSMKRESPGGL